MEKQDLKRLLAGMGIVSLLAGASFTVGCSGTS